MKTVVVLSGKGGTGKTSVTASLAALEHENGRRIVLADADVDASNLPILLRPEEITREDFFAGESALVDPDICDRCGLCEQHCRFNAIAVPEDGGPAKVTISLCEGCGVCELVCPQNAISMQARLTGYFSHAESRFGPMVHAHLAPGGESSGKLVTLVREEAAAVAGSRRAEIILVDGPPGMGCPVVSSLTGADIALMVTEPSPSARSDLGRVLKVARHFKITTAAVINKADLNGDLAAQLEEELRRDGVRLLGRIPYDTTVARHQHEGLSPAEGEGPAAEALREIHRQFRRLLDEIERTSLPVRTRR